MLDLLHPPEPLDDPPRGNGGSAGRRFLEQWMQKVLKDARGKMEGEGRRRRCRRREWEEEEARH